MKKRAALYLRQSKSDDEGIERQIERTTALATARGWAVAETFIDDDVTASKPRGPKTAWGRMLAAADALDVVIGVDLDRVVRSTRDLNTLIDHRLMLATVDGEIDLTTADGEFRASMLASIARFEVRRKGERQTRANAQRAAKGGVPKGVRLKGYTTAGEVVHDEAATVRALFDGFSTGLTLRTLSRQHGLTPSTVRTILTNPRYAGRRVYKGEVVGDGDWEAIVPGDQFDSVNRGLADPRRQTNRTGSTARKHLGTSLFRCGECSAVLSVKAGEHVDGPTVRTAGSGGRYWCQVCSLVRTMAPIDDAVLKLVQDRLSNPDALAALTPDVDTDPLRDEHAALSERKATLAGLVADGTMSRDDVRDAVARLNARLSEIDRVLQAAGSPMALLTEEEQRAGIAALNLDRQRALIDYLMTVSLLRAPRGRKGFNPSTVLIAWKG
ncbi:recombinase family protein [Glaciihabitans sp. INWT7]|uniref:recombinase family protein n=1 Tax=Glaciihabitans sp. INWT7 TaxID=2596912 RepID=UPI00162A3633|nr:recombinase family protein [Glaciihabitans sp. INWT7]QNE47565.1 recombinase family protein [Glaciihabitans sp. INWT7]